MARNIRQCTFAITPVPIGKDFELKPETWLAEQASQHNLTTLLAHADNGVIWGKWTANGLALSSDAFSKTSPPFLLLTLQQIRLFGSNAELFLWRDVAGAWRGRLLADDPGGAAGWYFDEPHLQWGDHREADHNGFTLVAEGEQGLRHAVPIELGFEYFSKESEDSWHPLHLIVRQYLEQIGDGTLVITQGRLVELRATKREKASHEQRVNEQEPGV